MTHHVFVNGSLILGNLLGVVDRRRLRLRVSSRHHLFIRLDVNSLAGLPRLVNHGDGEVVGPNSFVVRVVNVLLLGK